MTSPWWRRLERAAEVTALTAMVLTPLGDRGGRWRRGLTGVIVGAGAIRSIAADVRVHGVRRGLTVGAAAVTTTWIAEVVGLRTGRPFGRYHYTTALRPQLAGVPVHVPLAWSAMAGPAHSAGAAMAPNSGPVPRLVAGASALTAWDVFLDPQMTAEGYWEWARGGGFRGVPLSNFAGWLVVSAAVMAVRELVLESGRPDRAHELTYGVVAVMQVAAFATFLRDRGVAVAGATAMLTPVVVALTVRR